MKLRMDFLEIVSQKNELQKNNLLHMFQDVLTPNEIREFEEMLMQLRENYSMEELVEAYLFLVEETFREMVYFFINKKYRYSTLEEVNDKVYQNQEYMTKLMLGLQISEYLWVDHILIHRWYLNILDKIDRNKEGCFLEIGPGHGHYFLEAVNRGIFKEYIGIDVSPSSIALAEEHLKTYAKYENYRFICADINSYTFEKKFDMVTMSEVIEHVEHPENLLKRIYEITKPDADIYITVPINAPALDHIYLFRNIQEVIQFVRDAGFEVHKQYAVTSRGGSDTADLSDREEPIILALWLRRKTWNV